MNAGLRQATVDESSTSFDTDLHGRSGYERVVCSSRCPAGGLFGRDVCDGRCFGFSAEARSYFSKKPSIVSCRKSGKAARSRS
jgi:hypothetical protein